MGASAEKVVRQKWCLAGDYGRARASRVGAKRYPEAREIFITADAGGSNSYRSHVWKHQLQRVADKLDMSIHVSHFPPGTSKWNKVSDPDEQVLKRLRDERPAVTTTRDNQQSAAQDVVLFALHPPAFPQMLDEVKGSLKPDATVVSLAPNSGGRVTARSPRRPPTLQVSASPSRYAQGPGATASLGSKMRGLDLEGPVLIVAAASRRRRRSPPARSSYASWKRSKKPSPEDWQ